jgi:phosphopantothenate-cysteine ligase
MHRQFSQQPFLRHYSHSTNPFLDLLDIEEAGTGFSTISPPLNPGGDPMISVNVSPDALPLLVRVLRENKRVKQLGTLHTVTFVTVNDYLFLLRGIAGVIGGVDGPGRMVMYYLAAAVSDFYLPRQKMASTFIFTPITTQYVVVTEFSPGRA